ncbi:hypothetical protein OROGR_011817 [Orobanche gracilis]
MSSFALIGHIGIFRSRYGCDNNININSGGNSSLNWGRISATTTTSICSKISISRRPQLTVPPVVDGEAVVGSSNGWIAVFNKRSNDLFLSDPLSHRRIDLPPIHTLVDPEFNLDLDGRAIVSKVILSSSPDAGADDCRALMSFGPTNKLAFCVPGRSSRWTPLGDRLRKVGLGDHDYAIVHEDFVYRTGSKTFTSVTTCDLNLRSLVNKDYDIFRLTEFGRRDSIMTEKYDWDIQDPDSPSPSPSRYRNVLEDGLDVRILGRKYVDQSKWGINRWMVENMEVLLNECVQIPHIVCVEERDELFLAIRFVRVMTEDGASALGFVPSCEAKGLMSGVFGGKTFGFIVMDLKESEYDHDGYTATIKDGLDGMSMFVGINHSYAICDAGDEFKPNCIYFTDANALPRLRSFNDCGVFDYATKIISACDFDDAPTQASPIWLV